MKHLMITLIEQFQAVGQKRARKAFKKEFGESSHLFLWGYWYCWTLYLTEEEQSNYHEAQRLLKLHSS